MLIKLKDIKKEINNNVILNNINLNCNVGKVIAIKGKSGAGKSTLLNIIAGLERATSGDYSYNEIQMNNKSVNFLTKFRRSNVGYISQHSPMIPELTVLDNICVPLWFERNENNKKEYMSRIETLSHLFEIKHLLNQKINLLSGGELQRVGIIRSLIKKPKLIIADEPTGALDEETELTILNHFISLKLEGTTVIIATHSDAVSKHCDEIYLLSKNGLSLVR